MIKIILSAASAREILKSKIFICCLHGGNFWTHMVYLFAWKWGPLGSKFQVNNCQIPHQFGKPFSLPINCWKIYGFKSNGSTTIWDCFSNGPFSSGDARNQIDNGISVTCPVICPRARADLHMAYGLVPNSGDILSRWRIQNVFRLLLVPGICEIEIAIVHSARGLTLIFSLELILHIKCFQFSGDCHLTFTELENNFCRSDTSSSFLPQVTCHEVQTRGPNSSTSLILDVQPGCNVTWSRHSNVARPAPPSCWWGICIYLPSFKSNFL